MSAIGLWDRIQKLAFMKGIAVSKNLFLFFQIFNLTEKDINVE